MNRAKERICDYLREINDTTECKIFKTVVHWTSRSIIGLVFITLTVLTIVFGFVLMGWVVDQAKEIFVAAGGLL